MDPQQFLTHLTAYKQGLLAIKPDPQTGWDKIDLPTWQLSSPGLATDVYRQATRNAESTGVPQRVVTHGGEGANPVAEVITPNYRVRAALTERSIIVPGWQNPRLEHVVVGDERPQH